MPGELTPLEPWEGVLDFAECALFVADHELNLLWCNDALTSVLGWTREQLLAADIEALTHPDDRADALRITIGSLTRMQARSFVCRMVDAHGKWRWVRWDGRPLDGQRIVGRARRLDHASSTSAPSPLSNSAETTSVKLDTIVHDFNNLMFALAGGIELAHEQMHSPDMLVDTLSMLDRAIDQARTFNQRLLELV